MGDQSLEVVLLELRERLKRIEERLQPLPSCLTYGKAAKQIGIGVTKLKEMIRRGEIRTTDVGGTPMVSMSEIHRITEPDPIPLPRAPRSMRAKGSQDPRALDALLKKRT